MSNINYYINSYQLRRRNSNNVKSYTEVEFDLLVVELDDGSIDIFDICNERVRNIPDKITKLDESEFTMELCKRLKRAMWYRNITQKELAESVGANIMTINSYINGKRDIPLYTLFQILNKLNCEYEDIFF